MKKRGLMIGIAVAVICVSVAGILYWSSGIPDKTYSNEDFHIQTYISTTDKDADGIDDQTDILNNVKRYISTKPQYKSKYYTSGYLDDQYGVCTDVVAWGLKDAGYDLMLLVNEDIQNNPEDYPIETVDPNIDFRRVRNLKVFLRHQAISLTTDITQIAEWQGGDIVVFDNHIGVISDQRNKKGIPLVIHHANPYQRNYEEDILEARDDVVGHYRIS